MKLVWFRAHGQGFHHDATDDGDVMLIQSGYDYLYPCRYLLAGADQQAPRPL
jgi:hypothetical protein